MFQSTPVDDPIVSLIRTLRKLPTPSHLRLTCHLHPITPSLVELSILQSPLNPSPLISAHPCTCPNFNPSNSPHDPWLSIIENRKEDHQNASYERTTFSSEPLCLNCGSLCWLGTAGWL